MSRKQKTAIIALPVLVLTMICVYRVAIRLLPADLAWYIGFLFYWPLWCILYPRWILGGVDIRDLFRPSKIRSLGWAVFIFPPAMAFVGLFIINYGQPARWEMVVQVIMSFANGTLEEVLWRGVYTRLFPGDWLWGWTWPTIWFALWHYAPGSLSQVNVLTLMAGALVFGACWGWLAVRTDSMRYSAASHTLSGLVRVLG